MAATTVNADAHSDADITPARSLEGPWQMAGAGVGGVLGAVALRSRRGMANSVFTVVALPFLLLVIGLMLYFGRWLYVHAAMNDAAAAGARWAVTSLGGAQGCAQARAAMLEVVSRHNLNRSGARIAVTPQYLWGRGFEAEVTVAYKFGNSWAPIIGPVLGDSTATARYRVVIDEHQNRYANGWTPCVG